MAELTLSDATLYYEVHPAKCPVSSNPPLVLIAGLASDSQSWQPVLGTLQQNRTIVLLDNRGAGRTRAPTQASLTQMAQDCLALCDHLNLDSFDLIGHSMGGFVALNVIKTSPTRVRRLVLANSSARQSARNQLMFTDWANALASEGATARWYRTFFYWILTRQFFENHEAVEQLVKLAQSYAHGPNALAFKSQVLAMAEFDATVWLTAVKSRTLVLTSSEDLLFPPGQDASGLAAIPEAAIRIVPGLGHSLPLEAPKVFCQEVLGFLESI